MQIGPAHGAGLDPHENLAGAGQRQWSPFQLQWLTGSAKNHGLHRLQVFRHLASILKEKQHNEPLLRNATDKSF